MIPYLYEPLNMLAEKLLEAGIGPATLDYILKDGWTIRQDTPAEEKADWFSGVKARMDPMLDEETRKSVREVCALIDGR
jgi:hypothetical protein